MAQHTKKQLARFDDYDDLRKARLSSEEIKKIDREASEDL